MHHACIVLRSLVEYAINAAAFMAFVCEVKEMHIHMKERRRLLRGLIQIARPAIPSTSKNGLIPSGNITTFANGNFSTELQPGEFFINFTCSLQIRNDQRKTEKK